MLSPNDKILTIDIGGSGIKATILDAKGELLMERKRIVTPSPATPDSVLAAIRELTADMHDFTKVSAGFPGLVRDGIVLTAPNLDNDSWKNIDIDKILTETMQCPARVLNDADMQGLGVVSGKGFEMMITLGTGFGTALLFAGKLLPHFEIAHHPFAKGLTYDEYAGNEAFETCGHKKWNKRIQKIITVLHTVYNYDTLYIGGGNAKHISGELPENIRIVSNKDGIKGGAKLWDDTASGIKQ